MEDIKKIIEANNLPQVEENEVTTLFTVWDGNGEPPTDSYSYQVGETEWINYSFKVINPEENLEDQKIRVTGIELI